MATKSKGTIRSIVDSIGELLRQPLSDESNEVPGKKAVRASKRVAAGPRRKAKAVKAKVKKAITKKRAALSRRTKTASRKKKR